MGAFQGPRDWGRLLTAMLTPFHEDGSLNEEEAKRIATWLVDVQRNEGLVVSGTTGESPTLDYEEKLRLLEVTLEAVGDRAAVVFGAGTYDTAESVELATEAESRGAHGIMLVSPYYSRPGQEGLFAHFSTIAEAVSLPVMLYNIPSRSAINLETPTLLRLAEIENIVAVKESSGNPAQIDEVCASVPEGFRVYSGDDGMTLALLALGGYGVVSVAGHVAGAAIREMIEKFVSAPHEARQLHRRVMPLVRALFRYPSPVPVKYAVSLFEFDCARVRLPLTQLTPEEEAFVGAAVREFAGVAD